MGLAASTCAVSRRSAPVDSHIRYRVGVRHHTDGALVRFGGAFDNGSELVVDLVCFESWESVAEPSKEFRDPKSGRVSDGLCKGVVVI